MSEMQVAMKAAEEAGKIIMNHFEAGVTASNKSATELVTKADLETEKRIREIISGAFPEHGIIGEEEGGQENKKTLWVVDPIDGTTNFVHRMPWFCTSIALAKEGEPVLGVVFNPVTGERFTAEKGKGAFLNGKRIKVSLREKLQDSLLATGFPYARGDKALKTVKSLENLMDKCRGFRRLGSAALDCCYVALGVCDAYFEYSIHAWDIAAGSLIVREAGGKLSLITGEKFSIFGGNIIASNGLVCKELFRELVQ